MKINNKRHHDISTQFIHSAVIFSDTWVKLGVDVVACRVSLTLERSRNNKQNNNKLIWGGMEKKRKKNWAREKATKGKGKPEGKKRIKLSFKEERDRERERNSEWENFLIKQEQKGRKKKTHHFFCPDSNSTTKKTHLWPNQTLVFHHQRYVIITYDSIEHYLVD